jgi:hypothetical protein
MRNRLLTVGLAGVSTALLATGSLMADEGNGAQGKTRFETSTRLVGYQEVPSQSTTAKGKFTAVVDTEANTITWSLNYEGLEGTVTQAHVHFGQPGVSGGISFFLCSNLANPPAGTQACPAPPALISGVITPDQVIGPAAVPPAIGGQGIEPGAFAEIAAAIKAGYAYANVHSTKWPAGEIRGQLN